jgi:hypothetical protein
MSRSFDILTESTASVEQVHTAFGCEDYWLARHAIFDAASTLDSLSVDADGTVTVRATQHLGRRLLPGVVAQLVPGELEMLHSETWRPVGDHRVRGQVNISAPGALGSGSAEAWLAPLVPVDSVDKGSQLRFAATVEVKIPLVGGKIESYVGSQLTDNITAIQRFTTTWITEHG